MERKTEEALARWPYGRPTRSDAHMQAISLEVIMAVVFGVTDPDRVERLRAATLALMREGNSKRFFMQTMIAQRPRATAGTGRFPRIRRAMAAVDAIVLEEVAERRAAGDLDQDDVLGMFLRARDEHGAPMPDDELCDAMRTLLLGGHETTASTLTWILERVTRHPDVLARLETAALDGDDDYIDAVIKEAMRLRPVFPITARLATEPFELPGTHDPGRHARHPAHHARAPPPRPLPRPARLPPRALPRHPRRHLHLDPLRRRTPTLPRRRLLPHRNPHRAAHHPPPRPPQCPPPNAQNESPATPSRSSPHAAAPSPSHAADPPPAPTNTPQTNTRQSHSPCAGDPHVDGGPTTPPMARALTRNLVMQSLDSAMRLKVARRWPNGNVLLSTEQDPDNPNPDKIRPRAAPRGCSASCRLRPRCRSPRRSCRSQPPRTSSAAR